MPGGAPNGRGARWVLCVGAGLVTTITLAGAWVRSAVLRDVRSAVPCPSLTPPVPPPASLRQAFLDLPVDGGTHTEVWLLPQNGDAWLARWNLVQQARSSIDLSTFILDDDLFGIALLAALLQRAEAGVHVRILLDGFGTDMS